MNPQPGASRYPKGHQAPLAFRVASTSLLLDFDHNVSPQRECRAKVKLEVIDLIIFFVLDFPLLLILSKEQR